MHKLLRSFISVFYINKCPHGSLNKIFLIMFPMYFPTSCCAFFRTPLPPLKKLVKFRTSGGFRTMSASSSRSSKSRTRSIRIMEVSPRDGLQNEREILPVELKLRLIEKLINIKLKAIEIGSFVSPQWVPQMASTVEIISHPTLRLARTSSDVDFSCLIPNYRGFEAFENANISLSSNEVPTVNEIALFVSATEGFSKANLNSSISDSISKIEKVASSAMKRGMKIRGYVSCAFGCPYEGQVRAKNVAFVTQQLLDLGCYEVAISDTIGVAVPRQIHNCLNQLAQSGINLNQLGIHCHDTFGTGLANVLAAVEMGIQTVDSSIGGIGGCPYSPGATGNIATEDVIYALESSGYSTGIFPSSVIESGFELGNDMDLLMQLEPIARVGAWINSQLGRENSSRVGKAVLARAQRRQQVASSDQILNNSK